jgi:hypothetical protein
MQVKLINALLTFPLFWYDAKIGAGQNKISITKKKNLTNKMNGNQ